MCIELLFTYLLAYVGPSQPGADMPARGGWRPVTGRFSLDSSTSLPRRLDAPALASARKQPPSSVDNLPPADWTTRPAADQQPGACVIIIIII